MATRAVIKLLASVSLFLFAAYHARRHGAVCQVAMDTNLSFIPPFQKEDDYARLIQYLYNLSAVREKIPPKLFKYRPLDVFQEEAKHDDDVFTVRVSIYPIDVLKLDPERQMLKMSVYVGVGWTDETLMWNSSDYGGVEDVELDARDVWIPTLTVLNAVTHHSLVPPPDHPIVLTRHGKVHTYFKFVLRTGCEVDFSYFPFDIQTCMVDVYSTKETGGHVIPGEYRLRNMFDRFTSRGEWHLLDLKMGKLTDGLLYLRNFHSSRLTVRIQRKSTFYVESMVATMAVFCFMNCLVFLIPSESGEKINFLVPIFFSNAVFTGYIEVNVPKGILTQVPLILDFLLFMWLWSVAAFLASVYVLKKFREDKIHEHFSLQRKPEQVNLAVSNKVGPDEESTTSSSYHVVAPSLRFRTFKWLWRHAHPPKLTHRKLDRLFFVLSSIIVGTVEGSIFYMYATRS